MADMDIGLLVAIIIGAGVVSGLNFVLLGWFYGRERARIEAVIQSVVEPGDAGGPSSLAVATASLADLVGKSVAVQIKTSLMGVESGLSRGERAIQGDLLADAHPVMGAIMAAFPRLGRRLARQPELGPLALDLLGKMGKPGNGGTPPAGDIQTVFHL